MKHDWKQVYSDYRVINSVMYHCSNCGEDYEFILESPNGCAEILNGDCTKNNTTNNLKSLEDLIELLKPMTDEGIDVKNWLIIAALRVISKRLDELEE